MLGAADIRLYRSVQITRLRGKLIETVTNVAAKLESEQDLRAKDQYVRFAEGYFHLFGQFQGA